MCSDVTTSIRFLLVCGSLRRESTNAAALRTVAALGSEDATFVFYDGMDGLPHYNPDLDRAPLPAAVGGLRDAIHGADTLLFSVPEYAGALPGSLKNLLDWTVGDAEPGSIYRKAVAWINVSTRGAANAHQSLRTVLGYVGATIVDQACAELPITTAMVDGNGLIADPQVQAGLRRSVRHLVIAARHDDVATA